MYAREVEGYGDHLTFGVSGKLIMNVLVMYDRQTETLWSQLLGLGVEGPLAGAKLIPLASLQTTWKQWKALHPHTLALRKGYRGNDDPYSDYYERDVAGVLGQTREDERLPLKALGIGVVINGTSAFFPYQVLEEELVVNDTLAHVPVVGTFQPETLTGSLFKRAVGDQILTFVPDRDDETPFPTMVDEETGSRWRSIDGMGFEGPLAGTILERVPSTSSFWFGWKDWHPDTLVYGIREERTE